MKRLNFYFVLLVLALLSCEEPATFTEPQPKGTSSLNKFPKRIQGKFLSMDDSSFLYIDKISVKRQYDYKGKIHSNELESSIERHGDTLIDIHTNQFALILHESDSIHFRVNILDTLFLLSEENILKKYKGSYFLNLKVGEDKWEVKRLNYSMGKVQISSIESDEEINILNEITKITDTTSSKTYSPSKKEFRLFLKKGGFSNYEEFKRAR